MSEFEYRAQITMTQSNGNGEIYKKRFNGACTVAVARRKNGAIAKKAEAYLEAVEKSRPKRSRFKKMSCRKVQFKLSSIPLRYLRRMIKYFQSTQKRFINYVYLNISITRLLRQ